MTALRCAATLLVASGRGAATVYRHAASSSSIALANVAKVAPWPADAVAGAAIRRPIHSAAAKLQPTKVPLSDEERRLLEKLGEPDHETRGYLSELYEEFDVGAENNKQLKQQQQQRKQRQQIQQQDDDDDGDGDSKKKPTSDNQDDGTGSSLPSSCITTTHQSVHHASFKSSSSDLRMTAAAALGLSNAMARRAIHLSARTWSSGGRVDDDDNGGQDQQALDQEISKPSMRDGRRQRLTDETAQVIWDHQEQIDNNTRFDYYPEQQKTDALEGVSVERGETGVFDVAELVGLLRDERLQDVAVVSVPAEVVYADYLVVATAVSPRQAKAITSFLKKLYKLKKNSSDVALKLEGADCDEWKVLDMGNIVLHLFDAETRDTYRLETLWTVGAEFDDLTRGLTEKVEVDVLQQHMDFVRSLAPQQNSSAHQAQ